MVFRKRGYISLVIVLVLSALSFIIVLVKYDLTKPFLAANRARTTRRLLGRDVNSPYAKQDPKDNTIYFQRNPNAFIDTLSACLGNWQCSVLFHHLGKTGGSVLRDKMFDNFPPNKNLYKKINGHYWDDWKNGNMTRLFKAKRELYCRAKFSSYQNVPFGDIVSSCRWLKPETFKIIALIPFREPAARTLSSINHFCNKGGISTKTNAQIVACMSCDHKKHQPFFDSFATSTNDDYTRNQLAATKLGGMTNVKVLFYDAADMEDLFLNLQNKMPTTSLLPIGTSNTGQTDICDFGMNSKMINLLAPSFDLYRKFSNANLAP